MLWIWVTIAMVVGFIIGLLCMSQMNEENLSKEEYMHAVQMVLNDYDNTRDDVNNLLNEIGNYAGDVTVVYESLSRDARLIIDKVRTVL